MSVSPRTAAISSTILSLAHGRGPQAAEAAGLADRGHHRVVGHPAHAGQHDRVLDLEDVGESRAHGRHRRPGDPLCPSVSQPAASTRAMRTSSAGLTPPTPWGVAAENQVCPSVHTTTSCSPVETRSADGRRRRRLTGVATSDRPGWGLDGPLP